MKEIKIDLDAADLVSGEGQELKIVVRMGDKAAIVWLALEANGNYLDARLITQLFKHNESAVDNNFTEGQCYGVSSFKTRAAGFFEGSESVIREANFDVDRFGGHDVLSKRLNEQR